jgi:hypothetical protein
MLENIFFIEKYNLKHFFFAKIHFKWQDNKQGSDVNDFFNKRFFFQFKRHSPQSKDEHS